VKAESGIDRQTAQRPVASSLPRSRGSAALPNVRPKGRRRSASCSATVADLQRGEWIDPDLRRTLFSEWADVWWMTTVGLRPTTRRGYWQILHNHVLPHFQHRQLASIDFMDIERLRSHQARRGQSRSQEDPGLRLCLGPWSMKAAVKSGSAPRQSRRWPSRPPCDAGASDRATCWTMSEIHALVAEVRDPYKTRGMAAGSHRHAASGVVRPDGPDLWISGRHLISITETLLPVSAYGESTPHPRARANEDRSWRPDHPDSGMAHRPTCRISRHPKRHIADRRSCCTNRCL